MPGLLADDPDRAGYALLRPDLPRELPLSVSIRFLDGTYLGPEGRRTRIPYLFAAEPRDAPATYALGPAVTAHILEAEVITLADSEGATLGTTSWDGIRPPPGFGHGALLGGPNRAAGPIPPVPPTAISQVPSPRGPTPASASLYAGDGAVPRPKGRRRRIGMTVAVLALVGTAAGWAVLVLSGRVGWEVDPPALALSSGGPTEAAARLRPLWPAKPFRSFLSRPFQVSAMPSAVPGGLILRQAEEGGEWVLRVTTSPGPVVPGRREIRVPIGFPLGGTAAGHGVDVALVVPQPPSPPPPPPPPPSPVDDAACDRVAGNRLDPDHPAGRGFVDDVFTLPAELISAGLATCDRRMDRGGPDRRLVVQRGRLLAARAVARASGGDGEGARADMEEAVAEWRAGSALGSGFADNLLGSYLFGAFDRPGLTFVRPDDTAATDAWRRGAARGSIAAQRNYAAQLLAGHGVGADPAQALVLLRDALARGDEAAAGVLGVALYTGFPSGVPRDAAEGWQLIVRAQCVDRPSGNLLSAEIARGAHPPADRRACP